jgi:hypothetical protein
MVGALSPVSIVAGQYLTGVLTADDPDRAQGDSITRIEFSTMPEVAGLTALQIPVSTGDRHSYSILIPSVPNMPNTVGTFTVYDARGASSRAPFPITFQGTNPFTQPGGTAGTQAYCAALSEALKLNGFWGVALPVICNTFSPKL